MICGTVLEHTRHGGGPAPATCGSEDCRKKKHAQAAVEYRWRQRGGSTTQERICLECGEPFEFVRTQGTIGRGSGFCSDDCRDKRRREGARKATYAHRARLSAEERSRLRRKALLATFGLTPERYGEMVAAQDGVCAICHRPDTKHHSSLLKIDHDRSCCPGHGSCGKCVRGLLCSACNTGIGLFEDDLGLLQAAADYLRSGSDVTAVIATAGIFRAQ
jgi:hypothetical protein